MVTLMLPEREFKLSNFKREFWTIYENVNLLERERERELREREFKGLLNYLRERIKHVYKINLLGTALKKSALQC